MMVFYTRSAHEAKRFARALQTLTGKYTPPVLTADGRYRLQDDTYSAEMATALNSLLRHGVRANQCTPERVTAELTRLMRHGKVKAGATSAMSGAGHEVDAPPEHRPTRPKGNDISASATIDLPITAPRGAAFDEPLAGDQLLAALSPLQMPPPGRAVAVRAPIPMAGAAVAELNIASVDLPIEQTDSQRLTTTEYARRYGIAVRSPRRETDNLPGWRCDLTFVEEAEDPTIFPARQHKRMACFIPAAAISAKLTAADVLCHLRGQAQDLESHGEKFDDWCKRHGLSVDSRMAELGWKQARRHLRDLRGFLGMHLLRELLATRD